jgi:lysophospholipase L1-like esterase
MPSPKWIVPLCGFLLLPAAPAAAATGPINNLVANGYVLGDSLGEGVQEVSRLKGFAHVSVHIRGPRMLEQLAQTPPNATVILVLGTNDANGSILRLDKSIDDIVQAAAKKSITLIWLGPPCVRPSWDSRARELDGMLKTRFTGTPVRYVSMRDPELCSGALQEPDGVHLKTKGYVHMWEKAAAAAGYALASAAPAPAAKTPPQSPIQSQNQPPNQLSNQPSNQLLAARIPLPLPRRPLETDITGSIAKMR